MRRYLFIILLLFVSGSGCESGPRISPFGEETVILAFGDSLTYGTGAPASQSYPEALASLIERPVINAGLPGEVTSAGRERLPGQLAKHRPTLVILCHGGNDFLRRLDPEATARNLRAMIELSRASGADVLLIGVPKLGFGLEVPAFYPALAKDFALPYQGEILIELLGDHSMKSDPIHPNADGYRLLAEAIHNSLRRSF